MIHLFISLHHLLLHSPPSWPAPHTILTVTHGKKLQPGIPRTRVSIHLTGPAQPQSPVWPEALRGPYFLISRPFILQGHLQHKEIWLNFQLQNNITFLPSKNTFPTGIITTFQKLLLLQGAAVKPPMDQLQDMNNTYKCSICSALQPANQPHKKHSVCSLQAPTKSQQRLGRGALKVLAVINKPLVRKQTIMWC